MLDDKVNILDESELMRNRKQLEKDGITNIENLAILDFDYIDQCSYCQTFKVYSDTTFDGIKQAAILYWGGLQQSADEQDQFDRNFVLTDEYFNNLATYKDTVQNFYAQPSGYKPLNQSCFASVYLIKKNAMQRQLHFLQMESTELQDDNNKKDQEGGGGGEEEEDGEGGDKGGQSQKLYKIKLEKIAEKIIGLKTYEETIDDQRLNKYIEFSESHNNPNLNIWAFIVAIVLLWVNVVGKQIKNDSTVFLNWYSSK